MVEVTMHKKRSRKLLYLFIFNFIVVHSVYVASTQIVIQFLILQILTGILIAPIYLKVVRASQDPEDGKVEAGLAIILLLAAIIWLCTLKGALVQSIMHFFDMETVHPISNILKILYAAELITIYSGISAGFYLILSDKWIFSTGRPYKEQYWAAVGRRERSRLKKIRAEREKRHLLPISASALFVWFLLLLLAGVLVFWFYINTFAFK